MHDFACELIRITRSHYEDGVAGLGFGMNGGDDVGEGGDIARVWMLHGCDDVGAGEVAGVLLAAGVDF